jgi:hypothetical protein
LGLSVEGSAADI